MKTLAPAARVWSPGALVLGAADGEWGAGPPLGGEGAAARRPERMGAGTERRERLLHLQPPARRGRRSRVAASAQGSRALRARSLAEADPAPGERARVRPPGDLTRRSVHGLQADAAAADAAGEAIRPPARRLARALPLLAPPAARSTRWAGGSSARAARSSARRPSRGQARARTSSGAPGGCGTTLPRRRLHHRSALRPPPLPAPAPADRAPPTPRVLPPGGGEDGGLEGRREGAPGHAVWEQPGGATAIDEIDGQRSLPATRAGGQLLRAPGGEGHPGARGLGE